MTDSVYCLSGKMPYKNRNIAERVVKAMNKPRRAHNRKQTGHAPAYIYKCDRCGYYHISGRKSIRIRIKEG